MANYTIFKTIKKSFEDSNHDDLQPREQTRISLKLYNQAVEELWLIKAEILNESNKTRRDELSAEFDVIQTMLKDYREGRLEEFLTKLRSKEIEETGASKIGGSSPHCI